MTKTRTCKNFQERRMEYPMNEILQETIRYAKHENHAHKNILPLFIKSSMYVSNRQ
ncbi:MAG: hypothetical protein ACFFAV_17275 [Candidatus Hermodarchaeota archaeon]